MTDETTIAGIYEALNPLPALLTEKGKVRPEVNFILNANSHFTILMAWRREDAEHDWHTDIQSFRKDTFSECLASAHAFIASLPSREQAKLHRFMGKLGKLIDDGKSAGIEVEYMNPLVSAMKRLSENVITYQSSEPADAQT